MAKTIFIGPGRLKPVDIFVGPGRLKTSELFIGPTPLNREIDTVDKFVSPETKEVIVEAESKMGKGSNHTYEEWLNRTTSDILEYLKKDKK